MGDEDEVPKELSARVTHKNWKIRSGGYEQLASDLRKSEASDPIFNEYGPLMKKIVTDSNAAAQEKGLQAVLQFLELGDSAPRYAGDFAYSLVEKGLSAMKPAAKQAAQDCLLMMLEIEAIQPVQDALLKGFSQKNPKVVIGSVTVLGEAMRLFGPKVIKVKEIWKSTIGMFDHSNKDVRNAASNLVVEIYKYVGASLNVSDLRPSQVTELEAEFAKVQAGGAQPERYLRSQGPPAAAAAPADGGPAPAAGGAAPASAEDAFDPLDLVEPVEILSKLNGEFWELLASKKFPEQKQALDTLTNLSANPKLAPGDYGELMKTVKKLIDHSNIAVCNIAIKITANLAAGLRKDFSPYSKTFFCALLDKFKEKKPHVVESIHDALGSVFKTMSLSEVADDIAAAASHKIPGVRLQTLTWFGKTLEGRPAVPKQIKVFGDMLVKAMGDTDAGIRDAAAKSFGALAGIAGERAVNPFVERLDPIKQTKVKEQFQPFQGPASTAAAAAPSSKPRSAPASLTDDAPARPVPAKKAPAPAADKPKTAPAPKKPAASSRPAPAAKSKPAAAAGKPAGKSAGPPAEEDLGPDLSPAELEARFEEVVPESIRSKLAESGWKIRIEGMEDLSTQITNDQAINENAEVYIRFLTKCPGEKENNFQVAGAMCESMTKTAELAASIPKRTLDKPIKFLTEKLSDIKLKGKAAACLMAFAEHSGPNFILKRVSEAASGHKNPKVLSEGLLFVGECISEFGIKGVNTKMMIDFLKSCFENTNPLVKKNAINLLIIMRAFVGPAIRGYFNDVKDQLQKTIDQELEKGGHANIDTSQKRSVKETSESAPAARGGAGGAGGGDDGGLPREDISGRITSALLRDLSDEKWKVRQEALENLDRILVEANNRVSGNLSDLITPLKARLGDSNKNLACAAMNFTGKLAVAYGSGIEKYARNLLPGIVSNLSDNKTNVRSTAVNALDTIVSETGIRCVVPCLPTGLSVDSPVGKKELLSWAIKQIPAAVEDKNADVDCLVKPCLALLEDRTAEVRNNADQILGMLCKRVGFATIKAATSKLKPASLLVVNPIIDKYRDGGAAVAAPEAAPSKRPDSKGEPKSTKLGQQAKERQAAAAASAAEKKESRKAASEAAAAAASESALRSSNRDQRLKKEKKSKWVFEESMKEDLVECLKEQVASVASDDVASKVFSKDFKEQIVALTEMINCIHGDRSLALDNSDVLFKIAALRLSEGNTTVFMKTFEWLGSLFGVLEQEQSQLNDYDAHILLPALISNVGNNKDPVRKAIRELFKSICNIFPSSRLFSALFDGVKSKNSRARIECLDEMARLIERYGVEVCNQKKDLPIIAAMSSEKDNAVRSCALNVMATVYAAIRDSVWKFCGTLTDQQKSFLEARFKTVKGSAPAPKALPNLRASSSGRPASSPEKKSPSKRGPISHSPGKSGAQTARSSTAEDPFEAHKIKRSSVAAEEKDSGVPSINRSAFTLDLEDDEQSVEKTTSRPATASTARSDSEFAKALSPDIYRVESKFDRHLEAVQVGEVNARVDALKVLCHEMERGGDMELIPVVDRMLDVLTGQLRAAFQCHPPSVRLCKYSLNVMMQVFMRRAVASTISQETLQQVIQELLHRLLDERLEEIEEGQQLLKGLNVLTLKILENSDRTSLFSVLLLLLRLGSSQENSATFTPKFSELLVKCLLKLTKVLSQSLSTIHVDTLLRDLHLFLQANPPTKQNTEDLAIRSVKTILNELVKLLGDGVRDHLQLVPMEQDPIIASYIDMMLKKQGDVSPSAITVESAVPRTPTLDGQPGSARTPGRSSIPSSIASPAPSAMRNSVPGGASLARTPAKELPALRNSVPSGSALARTPAKGESARAAVSVDATMELGEIFDKIRAVETSKEGLADLQAFIEANPGFDLDSQLVNTSEQFRGYILRGLEKIRSGEKTTPIKDSEAGRSAQDSASGSVDDEVESHVRRLRSLQSRYGIKTTPTKDSSAAPEVDNTPVETAESASIAGVQSRSDSANEYLDRLRAFRSTYDKSKGGHDDVTATATKHTRSDSAVEATKSLEQIRSRLAKYSTQGSPTQKENNPNIMPSAPVPSVTNVTARGGGSSAERVIESVSVVKEQQAQSVASLRDRLAKIREGTK